jgi:hypothetical protein
MSKDSAPLMKNPKSLSESTTPLMKNSQSLSKDTVPLMNNPRSKATSPLMTTPYVSMSGPLSFNDKGPLSFNDKNPLSFNDRKQPMKPIQTNQTEIDYGEFSDEEFEHRMRMFDATHDPLFADPVFNINGRGTHVSETCRARTEWFDGPNKISIQSANNFVDPGQLYQGMCKNEAINCRPSYPTDVDFQTNSLKEFTGEIEGYNNPRKESSCEQYKPDSSVQTQGLATQDYKRRANTCSMILKGHKVLASNPRILEEILLSMAGLWEVSDSCDESCEPNSDEDKHHEEVTVAPSIEINTRNKGISIQKEEHGKTQEEYDPTWDFTENFKMFTENFQVSSTEVINYQDYLLCCPEELQLETDPTLDCGLWSLETGTIRYLENQNVCKTREYFPYTEQTHKRNKISKQNHFNPAHNNIPKNEHLSLVTERTDKSKTTNFDAYNCNKPQKKRQQHQSRMVTERATQPKVTNFDAYNCNIPQEILEEDRYMGVALKGTTVFDPSYDISATYLWSEEFSKEKQSTDSWFKTGYIPTNQHNMTTAFLVDQSRLITLFDSGATKTLIGKQVVDSHPILSHSPRFKITNQKPFKMADNKILIPIEAIQMIVKIGYHWFEIFAFVIDLMDDIDLIIGQKSMLKLEGNLNMSKLRFEFKQRSVPIFPNKTHRIAPGHTAYMNCTLDRVPPGLSDCEVILKLESKRVDGIPQTVKAAIKGDEIRIGITNPMEIEISPTIIIKHDQPLGIVDFRSAGYFHISRESLENSLKEHFMFVQNEDSLKIPGNSRLSHDKTKNITKEMTEGFKIDKNDPYPWLEPDDPRRKMTDREIIETSIDLSESNLTRKEKKRFIKTLRRHRNVFSLRDEIGSCPSMEVHLELTDYTPFQIRPFPAKEDEKELINKQMRKGCLLGILKKNLGAYSSPIMLIPRKLGGIPRIVTDFRHLNSRLVRLNPSIPLVRDAIQILGAAECDVLSVIDLRDAYHTINLARDSQQYCGITPYYGSPSYQYQVLPMGLSVSPAIWHNFITKVLDEIPAKHRSHFLAIMDDIIIHSMQEDHKKHLKILFRALDKYGLKISPKKCQLFRKEIVYMGHTMLIQDSTPCITPLKTRVEAIMLLPPPTTPKGCKSFCGMVNYLGMYCPNLQEDLIPIYKNTKKTQQFEWTAECQKSFKRILKKLSTRPILVMPNNTGKLTLTSDTSKIACGGALYQEQKGVQRLCGYYSKKLPEAASRYSISELELFGMLINITAFKNILRNVDFNVFVDHSALVNIVKAKREPPTLRLMKLLEHLSEYAFSLAYMKGRDLHLTDFLSRHPTDDDDPTATEIIPISFMMNDSLEELDFLNNLCTVLETETSEMSDYDQIHTEFLKVHTRRSQPPDDTVKDIYPLTGDTRKPEHTKTDEVPYIKESEDDHMEEYDQSFVEEKTDHDPIIKEQIDQVPIIKENVIQIPIIIEENTEQTPIEDHQIQPPEQIYVPKIPDTIFKSVTDEDIPEKDKNASGGPLNFEPEPLDITLMEDQNPILNIESIPLDIRLQGEVPGFDDNYPMQDIPTLRHPDPSMYKEPARLFDQISDSHIFRKHIPKQVELSKFMKVLKMKIVHDYEVPISLKELQADFKHSPYFKDIRQYITKGTCNLPESYSSRRLFKLLCEDFIVVDGILFRIKLNKNRKLEPKLVLCIPETYIPTILYQHHDHILAGHQGVTKMYMTLKEKYWFPWMFTIIREYVLCCDECQSRRIKDDDIDILFPRIPLDFRPMARISADIKYMPKSGLGYHHILLCTCEISNYVVGVPIKDLTSVTIAEALFYHVICVFGPPKSFIIDEAKSLTSEVMLAIYASLNIKPHTISPYNHGSNRTERYIQTANNMICKYLTATGDKWPLYVYPCCYAMNTFVSANTGFSAYEMVFLHTPPDLHDFEVEPDKAGRTLSHSEYLKLLETRYVMMKDISGELLIKDKHAQKIREDRKHPNHEHFAVGDLVYIIAPTASSLQTRSRKLKREWSGPLKVQVVLEDAKYVISDWWGNLIPIIMHEKRLKSFHMHLGKIENKSLHIISTAAEIIKELRKIEEEEKIDFSKPP